MVHRVREASVGYPNMTEIERALAKRSVWNDEAYSARVATRRARDARG